MHDKEDKINFSELNFIAERKKWNEKLEKCLTQCRAGKGKSFCAWIIIIFFLLFPSSEWNTHNLM